MSKRMLSRFLSAYNNHMWVCLDLITGVGIHMTVEIFIHIILVLSLPNLPHPIGYLRVVSLLVFLQKLLKHMSVSGFYPLVVLLLCLDNVEPKLRVKLDRTLVVHLNMEKYGGVVAILLDDVEDMLKHSSTNP